MNDLFGRDTGPQALAMQLFMRGKQLAPEDNDLRSFSVRMSAPRLAMVDAMATHAQVSRNRIANELMRLGMEAVLAELPSDLRDEIEQDWLSEMASMEGK